MSCPAPPTMPAPAPAPAPQVSSSKLAPYEEKNARDLFEAYDYDGGGTIDGKELGEMLTDEQWCMDEGAMADLIAKTLAGGESQDEVTFPQFLEMYAALLARQPSSVRKHKGKGPITISDLRELEAEARRIFGEVDDDGSGVLSMDEMREVMERCGLPDTDGDRYDGVLSAHMQAADKDNDGRIDFEEFVVYRNAVLTHARKEGEASPDGGAGAWEEEGELKWAWHHFAN